MANGKSNDDKVKKPISKIMIFLILMFGLNVLLAVGKLLAGFIGGSPSLVSDGFNSLLDVFISLILIVAYHFAQQKEDDKHPFGHDKFEGVAYLIITLIVAAVGVFILYQGVFGLIDYFTNNNYERESSFVLLIVVACVAIVVKMGMFFATNKMAKKHQLSSLKADSYNHLFDIFATTAALIGIIMALNGIYFGEYIAQIIIAFVIIRIAVKMFLESISYLVDEAPEAKVVSDVNDLILSVAGVESIDVLKIRKHMQKLYVEVEINVSNKLSLEQAHDISEVVHDAVEDKFDVVHCAVHVNPIVIDDKIEGGK